MTLVEVGIPVVRSGRPSLDGRPDTPYLLDRFGRVARDLRVSITEKCSLRCTYCMPEEGLPEIPRNELLTVDEIVRLVGLAVRELGVREVRFTGGEPLMRRDLEQIIAGCHEQVPHIPLAMTTNGVGLEHRARALAAAGLHRVNVSLDTVDRVGFARLTRRDRLDSTLAGIRAARQAGLVPVKVNAVLMRETLSGASDLLQWCLDENCELRFIEEMPLDADHEWARANMVTAAELLDMLGGRFELTAVGRADPSAPAEKWLVDGGPATVGIIATVTRKFCDTCDRTRLTADGMLRSCLFSDQEFDLRQALRSGADDDELATLWRGAMWNKWAGHGIDAEGFVPRNGRWEPSVVEIRYFAAIADAVGKDHETLEFPAGATIADLRATLSASYGPDLDKMLSVCAYLIGDELTRDPGVALSPQVDVLPPFAGG